MRPGLAKPKVQATKATPAPASEAISKSAPTPAPTPARVAMQPLPLADQVTTVTDIPRISIQELGQRLMGTDPVEVIRVLGVPEFTEETKKNNGLYYSSSQWGAIIYNEGTKQPVQRVKVLFFNGQCIEVQGI